MRFKLLRYLPNTATLIWSALSLVLFGTAVVLTLIVTAVYGHAPTQPATVRDSVSYLTAAILTPSWKPEDPVPDLVIEGIDGQPDWGLEVSVPANTDVKLLVDHLVPGVPCASPRSADEIVREDAYHKGIHATAQVYWTDARTGNTTYLVSIDPGEGPRRIHCEVRALAEPVTYTRRELAVSSLTMASLFGDAQQKMLQGYDTKSPVRLAIGLHGAENFIFSRYYESGRFLQAPSAAYVPQDAVITASWSNVYVEEMRDIILIVIGSLIALAVTVLIEAMRPSIELLGGKNASWKED